jgi:hypothetical protein
MDCRPTRRATASLPYCGSEKAEGSQKPMLKLKKQEI